MIRPLLLAALLSSACHTTVYRTESEPVRILVTRPRPRAPEAPAERPGEGEPGAPAPEGAGVSAPEPGARR